MKHPESEEQKKVIQYLQYRYPKVLFTASPAGVKLPIITAMNLKKIGCKAGVPDLLIFEPRQGKNGLMIELKTPKSSYSNKGRLSKNQIEWIDRLHNRGYEAVVCYGFDEAKNIIDSYFKLECLR